MHARQNFVKKIQWREVNYFYQVLKYTLKKTMIANSEKLTGEQLSQWAKIMAPRQIIVLIRTFKT